MLELFPSCRFSALRLTQRESERASVFVAVCVWICKKNSINIMYGHVWLCGVGEILLITVFIDSEQALQSQTHTNTDAYEQRRRLKCRQRPTEKERHAQTHSHFGIMPILLPTSLKSSVHTHSYYTSIAIGFVTHTTFLLDFLFFFFLFRFSLIFLTHSHTRSLTHGNKWILCVIKEKRQSIAHSSSEFKWVCHTHFASPIGDASESVYITHFYMHLQLDEPLSNKIAWNPRIFTAKSSSFPALSSSWEKTQWIIH